MYYWSGGASRFDCQLDNAFYFYGKALEINVAANSLWGISTMKSHLTFVYNYQGKINLAYENGKEAVTIAEESGDIFTATMAGGPFGASCLFKGYLEEAEERLSKALENSQKIKFLPSIIYAAFFLGELYLENGEYQKSIKYYHKAIRALESANLLPSWVKLCKICIAKAESMNNGTNINLAEFYKYEAENRVKLFDGRIQGYLAEILLNLDIHNFSEAKRRIKKAIETNTNYGMIWYLSRNYAVYAELYKRKGDREKAKEKLTKAIEILKECGADGWVERYEKELISI